MDGDLLILLGEIKGELSGIHKQIANAHESTNKRIDDLARSTREQTASVNRRINDHHAQIDQLHERVSNTNDRIDADRRKTVLSSGAVSAMVAACVQLIKAHM